MGPQFPIYIVSKGRSQYMITSRVLSGLGVDHFVVVEPQEVDKYIEAIAKMNLRARVIPLDLSYKERYELCDSFGLSKSTGSGPARNFAWDQSVKLGAARHWVMDDNITSFRRLNLNEKVKVTSGAIFRAMEDFVLRYKNISMAGPNYFMFASARSKIPPFVLNTKLYSCNLIRNDVPFRWRGRYNEDVILSLDMLKAGWCTVQFNAFLQEKMSTQTLKGGNTTELYLSEGKGKGGANYGGKGTADKSRMLVDVHPDVSKIVYRYGRIHHHVDYSRFKSNHLIRNIDLEDISEINNYNMSLQINPKK